MTRSHQAKLAAIAKRRKAWGGAGGHADQAPPESILPAEGPALGTPPADEPGLPDWLTAEPSVPDWLTPEPSVPDWLTPEPPTAAPARPEPARPEPGLPGRGEPAQSPASRLRALTRGAGAPPGPPAASPGRPERDGAPLDLPLPPELQPERPPARNGNGRSAGAVRLRPARLRPLRAVNGDGRHVVRALERPPGGERFAYLRLVKVMEQGGSGGSSATGTYHNGAVVLAYPGADHVAPPARPAPRPWPRWAVWLLGALIFAGAFVAVYVPLTLLINALIAR